VEFQRVRSRNRNNKFPTILLTDGNQTSGNDYIYSFDETNKVFPIVLGDTTKIVDLKISQINVNKYAFSKINFLRFFLIIQETKFIC
jgi:hypothetical protein